MKYLAPNKWEFALGLGPVPSNNGKPEGEDWRLVWFERNFVCLGPLGFPICQVHLVWARPRRAVP